MEIVMNARKILENVIFILILMFNPIMLVLELGVVCILKALHVL